MGCGVSEILQMLLGACSFARPPVRQLQVSEVGFYTVLYKIGSKYARLRFPMP